MAEGVVRRRDKRYRFVLLGIFVAVFLFSFLLRGAEKNKNDVEAASLVNFDPGYIISDYQMSNYSSMSEAEIQAFLTSKNSCGNYNEAYYHQLTANNPGVVWHFENGHFICLSEERFGDGEVIGSGETAAHILWQAAHDYHINPQVLLVLLQKETGLVTDPIPNNYDYRKATGYGCPDTAACSSEYYGFKNQIRHAAALFSTVLNGGWTNYPLGNNYIQYNPNPGCGGSVVNIRSLATSALYRYTPYQPNAETLAAGYGTAYCGAYGNRNFYLYFMDWFGNPMTNEVDWANMTIPRTMVVDKETLVIDAGMHTTTNEWVRKGDGFYFTKRIALFWGGSEQLCLQRQEDEGTNKCILMARMMEYAGAEEEITREEINPILMKLKGEDFYKYSIESMEKVQRLNLTENLYIKISEKIKKSGKEYYRTTHDVLKGFDYIIPSDALDENIFVDFLYPRNLTIKQSSDSINLATGEKCISYKSGETERYIYKITYQGKEYYQNKKESNTQCAVVKEDLQEATYTFNNQNVEEQFVDFLWPRQLRLRNSIYTIDASDGTTCDEYLNAGDVQKYITKITINDQVFYRSEKNTASNSTCVVPAIDMGEI